MIKMSILFAETYFTTLKRKSVNRGTFLVPIFFFYLTLKKRTKTHILITLSDLNIMATEKQLLLFHLTTATCKFISTKFLWLSLLHLLQ